MFNNKESSVDTRVAVLEERVSMYDQMMSKIEDVIQAISKTNQDISKMLAIHEERFDQNLKIDATMLKTVEELKASIQEERENTKKQIKELADNTSEEIKELADSTSTDIKDIRKDIEGIKKIKWMTIAIGITTTVIVAALASLASGWIPAPESHNPQPHNPPTITQF